ncbi:MAG: hypothetical protein KAS04_06990 [Candidatus Aenigmarchaeota archaeon]|nr:hypothetical protein [Candidatus Aenigmarchaeota archaeon]
MNQKMDRIRKSIDTIKKEREELKEKYNYLVDEMKKNLDKNNQDILFLTNELKSLTGREITEEGKVVNISDEINSLKKSLIKVEGKYALLRDKLTEDFKTKSGSVDSNVDEKIQTIRLELVDNIKSEIAKSSDGIKKLEKDVIKINSNNDKQDQVVDDIKKILNSITKSISSVENKQISLREKLKERIDLEEDTLGSQISERMGNLRSELINDIKNEIDKSSSDIKVLNSDIKKLQGAKNRNEEAIFNVKSAINLLQKDISKISGKHSILRDKIKEEMGLLKNELNSDITNGMKTVQSRLVNDIKSEIDRSVQGVIDLDKNFNKLSERQDSFSDKLSHLGMSINSLAKSLGKSEGKYAVLKEKLSEEMKIISNDINSRVSGRVDAMESSLRKEVSESLKSMKDVLKKNSEYQKSISELKEKMGNVDNVIYKMKAENSVLRKDFENRSKLIEKDILSELSKVKSFESVLSKDIENFQKFSNEHKNRMGKFESKVSNRIDMFGMENENMKRDFSELSTDFKNIENRLSGLKEKDLDLSQHIQRNELDLENSKKTVDEIISKMEEGNTIFKENLVAKLNETNEKITTRISKNEIKTSSEMAKQSEEIKLFRAHVTQFINDLVANYEKRFEMMKSEIDQSLRLIEERGREQRAMIFE